MKNSLCFAVLVGGILLVGCQQELAPVSSHETIPSSLSKAQLHRTKVIVVDEFVSDCGPILHRFLRVKGDIGYALTPSPIMNREFVDVRLSVNLSVEEPRETTGWSITTNSISRVDLTQRSSVGFEGVYPVSGRTDGLMLHVAYNVTRTSLSLGGMWFSYEGQID